MCQLLSQRPLPPARHQPHPLTPSTQTIVQEVKKKKEKKKDQLSANHIILPSPATQNTGLKEVDLEPKPKGSSDKINKLRPKSQNTTEKSINRISCKSILVDPIKLFQTLKEINQFLKLYGLRHIKNNCPKTTNSILMTAILSRSVTPREKTKPKPLANEKTGPFKNFLASF